MSYPKAMRHALAVLVLLSGPVLAAEPIVGHASVTDGDTVVIRSTRVRLHGIDAPESAQLCQDAAGKSYRCGQGAALALARQIGEAIISCEPRDTDRYGRTVAICRKGDEDLNAWMASQGYATAYQRYSRDYVGVETTARALKRGLWAGTFDPPSDWRRAKRAGGVETRPEMEKLPAAAPAPVQTACAIKGKISRKGDKIYHLPGTRDYDRTVITTGSGERMFCSEDEAKAAGWRGARG
ncbi:Endonuclease YncB, thermonuclease family [Methylobacterium sp. UNC300MFChir4.1]|uniref:thermonuclease family protein n=1 Tax=Methylobacterium sp. UNC300MFChir4.1 TaxID=1502747 RepID=UPI0008ABDD00|nr:thermonuclease family protein [Methylobacterium sp. UNC300MFChir4.1]SEP37514.1 Endonuclease YncB, thermonuclease family [Methylobacterium sp. UNC300MFChir4.1]